METVYARATLAINKEIEIYLDLINQSDSFQNLTPELFDNKEFANMFSYGIGVIVDTDAAGYQQWLINEYKRKIALKFDIENSVTTGVYIEVRKYVDYLYDVAEGITSSFKVFDDKIILANPALLPIFQNLLGFSKAQLIKKVGSASDIKISKIASVKLAGLLSEKLSSISVDKTNTLQRVEITIEGIVRDLVGRILFEDVVSHALKRAKVPFLREDEYSGISGVVYNIRADFVIPNEQQPVAFIEVRKSSSRHASLYAKDKMFSAINWKGKHKKLIGVIIVEGDWTQATLQAMSNIFDYVVPLEKSNELAAILKRAVDGDESVLKWLIEFSIQKSPDFK